MAWRIEKESTGKNAIIIDGWDSGCAVDPYSGMNRNSQVDLSVSGELSVGFPVTSSTVSGATLGTPIADSTRWFGYGSQGYVPSGSPQSFAVLDSGGHVFESTSITGTWNYLSSNSSLTGASADDGIAYWLGYLFKTRGANIDYWNGSTWVNAWQTTLTGSTKHFMYVATNNVLYITNGNFLASVTANDVASFEPTNSGTYVFNVNKLRLPTIDVAISLAEVGQGGGSTASTLLIGGIMNAIYPWDKVSTNFGFPIYIGESYVRLMVSVNQNVFIFPGNQQGRGRIYITNGSQANEFYKMPDYMFGIQDPYYVWGDAIFHRNFLLFGCFITTNASGGGSLPFTDVWALDLEKKTLRSVSNIAQAAGPASATCLISTANLSSPGFGYIAAWSVGSGGTTGIGYSGVTAGIGTATQITDLMAVGSFLDKNTPTNVEFKLRTPLLSGEGITITPIIDSVQGTALTFSPTPTTGVLSAVAPINFTGAQWLQFLVSITGNSASGGGRLRGIRVR